MSVCMDKMPNRIMHEGGCVNNSFFWIFFWIIGCMDTT